MSQLLASKIAQTWKRGSSARFYIFQDPDKTGHQSAPKIVTLDSLSDVTVELNHKIQYLNSHNWLLQ